MGEAVGSLLRIFKQHKKDQLRRKRRDEQEALEVPSSRRVSALLKKEAKVNPTILGGTAGLSTGAILPYMFLEKQKGETDEQFKARRRGIAAISAVTGGVAGVHGAPLLTHGRFKKTAGLKEYFAKQKQKAKLEMQKQEEVEKMMMTPEERKKEEERRQEGIRRRKAGFETRGYAPRFFETSAGAALLAKNVPQLGLASGRSTLYHGTGAYGLRGIMGEQLSDDAVSGLSTRFAGTKGRLNAVLMPNAIVRAGLQGKFDLSEADVLQLQNQVGSRIKSNKGKPLGAVVTETIQRFGKQKGLSQDKIKKMTDSSLKELQNAGMRIYFANSPDKVMTWADDKNELDKIMDETLGGKSVVEKITGAGSESPIKKQIKKQGRTLVNLAMGGGLDIPSDYKGQKEYYDKLVQHKEKVSPEFIQDLARKAESGDKKLRFVLGTRAPTDDMQMLADFKGISLPLRASPFLQSMMGSIPGFEGYDPNRDISTAKDVGLENIKHVDVFDEDANELKRYFLDSYKPKRLTLGQRAKSLGRASVPLAFAGLGANMMYRGVSGRKGVVGSGLKAIKDKVKEKMGMEDKSKGQKKTASVAKAKYSPIRSGAKAVLKYGLPLTAFGAGQAMLADKIGRTIVPVSEKEINPITGKDELEKVKKDTVRGLSGQGLRVAMGLGTTALASTVGRKLGRKFVGKQMSELSEMADKLRPTNKGAAEALDKMYETAKTTGGRLGMVGGAYGSTATVGLGAYTARKYQDAARGEDSLREELGESREEIARTPMKSAILPGLVTMGALGLGSSAMLKHYPGLIRKMKADMIFSDKVPGFDALKKSMGAAKGKDTETGLKKNRQIMASILPKTTGDVLEQYAEASKSGQGVSPEVLKFVASQVGKGRGATERADMDYLKTLAEMGTAMSPETIAAVASGNRKKVHEIFEKNQKAIKDLESAMGELNVLSKRKSDFSEQILENLGYEPTEIFQSTPDFRGGRSVFMPMPKETAERIRKGRRVTMTDPAFMKDLTADELKITPMNSTVEAEQKILSFMEQDGFSEADIARQKDVIEVLKERDKLLPKLRNAVDNESTYEAVRARLDELDEVTDSLRDRMPVRAGVGYDAGSDQQRRLDSFIEELHKEDFKTQLNYSDDGYRAIADGLRSQGSYSEEEVRKTLRAMLREDTGRDKEKTEEAFKRIFN